MKILTIICAALALCGLALAQYKVDTLTVQFSNPVMVGDATLPAGDCQIQILRGSGDTIILVFRPESGSATSALVNRLYHAGNAPESGVSVILRRSGNTSRVDRIVTSDGTGFHLLNSGE